MELVFAIAESLNRLAATMILAAFAFGASAAPLIGTALIISLFMRASWKIWSAITGVTAVFNLSAWLGAEYPIWAWPLEYGGFMLLGLAGFTVIAYLHSKNPVANPYSSRGF
tara:strand:+ start:146 stop:481 length:336 start_codon:yes stop_codon:yes gene_type:complete